MMQRSYFLVGILRIKLVDIRECTVVAPPNKSLLSDNASESFKNTCLSPVGHQVSVPEFTTDTVAQENKSIATVST